MKKTRVLAVLAVSALLGAASSRAAGPAEDFERLQGPVSDVLARAGIRMSDARSASAPPLVLSGGAIPGGRTVDCSSRSRVGARAYQFLDWTWEITSSGRGRALSIGFLPHFLVCSADAHEGTSWRTNEAAKDRMGLMTAATYRRGSLFGLRLADGIDFTDPQDFPKGESRVNVPFDFDDLLSDVEKKDLKNGAEIRKAIDFYPWGRMDWVALRMGSSYPRGTAQDPHWIVYQNNQTYGSWYTATLSVKLDAAKRPVVSDAVFTAH